MFNLFSKKKKSQPQNDSKEYDTGTVKSVIVSDLGNIRTNNEDIGLFFRIADEEVSRAKGCLMMVADGMGGHNAGEVASRMAADIISHEYFKLNGSAEKSLVKSYELANKNIFEMSMSNKSVKGMGTTCTTLVIADKIIYFAQVGDSRAYLLKNSTISRITEDQTYVQELVKSGEITAAEASTHPKRNILTNAMGTKESLRVDTGKFALPFEEKDRLMICSDGLYEYLNDDEIARILGGNSLHQAANELVDEAKKRGGHDNITVVLAEKVSGTNGTIEKQTKDFDIPQTKEFDLP
ncbi:MAG TPA: Stp1/IreP family PP2C-type Ser/Thr phosphatase [Chitinophagaceae bacterium]|nr:Stp1/IreP family PP2C-type Ser/Thr phosphatase [Chitinophagaceae bacterium]